MKTQKTENLYKLIQKKTKGMYETRIARTIRFRLSKKQDLPTDEWQISIYKRDNNNIYLNEGNINDLTELKINDASLELAVGNLIFKSKLIDGKFPDYQQVIPSGESSVLEINVKDFSETLSRVSVLSSEKYKGIRLITSSEGVRISANNPEQEEAEEFFPASYNGEDLDIAFNVTYLQEIMSHMQTDSCHINFFGSDKSCLLTPPGSDSPKYVVMPLLI